MNCRLIALLAASGVLRKLPPVAATLRWSTET